MKILFWDIETSDLKPDVGRILCASFLDPLEDKVWSLRNDKIGRKKNMADDGEIAKRIRDTLEDYHITVGWYSKGFDFSFVNTRLVKAGHKTIRPGLHLDPIWYCKGWRGIKARSSKMKIWAEFFDVERKPDVDVDIWIDAALGGDKKAMDELVARCEADVRITREITEKVLDSGVVKNITRYP